MNFDVPKTDIATGRLQGLWAAYKMRNKRRRFLVRAFRKSRQLASITNRTDSISDDAILVFSTVRNEIIRLPYFLEYYRALGVAQFIMVDNNSDDGTREYLQDQPDVSLWTTPHSYKLSRFGVDWITWLQFKFGHGHWCLTVDVDEILIYPHCDTKPLPVLTDWLDKQGVLSFGTTLLDMYPKGELGAQTYKAGQDPFEVLCWFDGGKYRSQMQPKLQNLWVQGGVRDRVFFADKPERAPTLNKTPLIKWSRRFAYVSSTHSLLPRHLNDVFDGDSGGKTTGILLHSKFLNIIVEKSAEEKHRQEHFANSELYDVYYDSLAQSPDLWCEQSIEYTGWPQLEALNLMSKGLWRP